MKDLLAKYQNLTVDKKAEVAHQAMMKLVIDEGWATKRYLGLWGKIIKKSGIYPEALEKLIRMAKQGDYNARGWTRNRLQNNDWGSWLQNKTK